MIPANDSDFSVLRSPHRRIKKSIDISLLPPRSVGDRVAQLILERIVTPEVLAVDDLDATDRVFSSLLTFCFVNIAYCE
jgi:hypothetical protein